jgi:hypothetical protein
MTHPRGSEISNNVCACFGYYGLFFLFFSPHSGIKEHNVEYVLIALVLANVLTLGGWWLSNRNSVAVVDKLLKERIELRRELTNRPLASKVDEIVNATRLRGLHDGYQSGFADGKATARRAVARSASQIALANFDKVVK